MGSYKRERRVYRLVFDDPEYEGLEIRVRSLPIGKLKTLIALDPEDESKEARAAAIEQLASSFAKALVSWNMTDEAGVPVPANLEALEDEDTDFVLMIIMQWLKVVSSVGDGSPLPGPSTSGKSFPVESIPMEPLSASLVS